MASKEPQACFHSTSEFRAFLNEELSRRVSTNPKYSLRAFSKSLKIHPATLSHLLKGHRSFTERLATRIGRELHFSEAMIRRTNLMIQIEMLELEAEQLQKKILNLKRESLEGQKSELSNADRGIV
jgi:plasmid maintenance system antidote protein VapI